MSLKLYSKPITRNSLERTENVLINFQLALRRDRKYIVNTNLEARALKDAPKMNGKTSFTAIFLQKLGHQPLKWLIFWSPPSYFFLQNYLVRRKKFTIAIQLSFLYFGERGWGDVTKFGRIGEKILRLPPLPVAMPVPILYSEIDYTEMTQSCSLLHSRLLFRFTFIRDAFTCGSNT